MYTPDEQRILLSVARRSIEHGLDVQRAPRVKSAAYPAALQHIRATFVTLQLKGALRGCIGTLDAKRALVDDVARNAYRAAFSDPRFAPVTRSECSALGIHLAVLSPPTPMSFCSEQDLIRQLQPGVDGLILQERRRHATFLPVVWESLPDARDFLRELKQKAGLPEDHPRNGS